MKVQKLVGVALCGLMVFLCWPAMNAQARTLEDILKDKGVITAADYAEVSKSSPVAYTPGKGLTATSSDGISRMHIGGYAQLIYRFTNTDDAAKDNKSDFDIRRFKLVVDGNVFSKNFGYKLQGDVSSGFRTEDVFVKYKFAPTLTLQVGQFKPPQARQELTGAGKQLFPERSLANDTFNLGRDQGIQAAGSFADKLIDYRIGLFNGNGPNVSNADDNNMLAGRVDINPFGAYKMDEAGWATDKPLLNIGGSFAWEKVGPNDVGTKFGTDNDVMDVALNLDGLTPTTFTAAYGTDLTWRQLTANVNARWMGASFAAEYYNLNAAPQLGASWTADGYYVQAGYQVIPKTLELGARYSAIKSTDANASAKFDKHETQLGANYYFAKQALKLQSDITLVSDNRSANKDDTIFRLQAQFYY
ncbi:porin [Geopsychrobacter electrodiphilus]|uniref:porin n=1 Tax=Geopsychrobacter electrodiphilus TaxID=225196 RepID=UPI000361C474|nr:porin [Geopsychrobacter electrodiphilus]